MRDALITLDDAGENPVLRRWNGMDAEEAAQEILDCCGSVAWAVEMTNGRPYRGPGDLLICADRVWGQMDVADWDEAFASHPRIGMKEVPKIATAQSAEWSGEEQSGMDAAGAEIAERLRSGNEAYERRFGRTYIVCASGKSAEEMLAILESRLTNSAEEELLEAAEEQRQIMQLRLRKRLQL